MDQSRIKLQTLCHTNQNGFNRLSIRREPLKIGSRTVFDRHHSAAAFRKVPANPFMVPSVIEDLKFRWNWKRINEYAADETRAVEPPESFPWAEITQVVPGEADVYTAEAAKEFGAPVLTGDSDFLIHDLGPNGCVIFNDSIETVNLDESDPKGYRVRATELSQNLIFDKLGISNLQRLGFELQNNPDASMSALVQLCKDYSDEEPSDLYRAFLKEYEVPVPRDVPGSEQHVLDPKVLELCTQYEVPELRSKSESPHVYFPVLTENYSRRCAWHVGYGIRRIGYSLFDAAFPKVNPTKTVLEYYRKGDRMVPSQALREPNINEASKSLVKRLNAIDWQHGKDTLIYWKTFALRLIWNSTGKNFPLEEEAVRRFLQEGYTETRLTLDDIHLYAQVQAVLYSLKMSRDLATAALPRLKGRNKEDAVRVIDALATLPPLRILSQSRCDLKNEIRPEGSIENAIRVLTRHIGIGSDSSGSDSDKGRKSTQESNKKRGQPTPNEEGFRTSTVRRKKKKSSPATKTTPKGPIKKPANIYDILAEEN